jgi:hypothetical protein
MFSEPVTESVASNYFDVIRSPMDISTIEGKNERGLYKSLQPFRQDVELMCFNALLFNNLKDEVWMYAFSFYNSMENFFERNEHRTHLTAFGAEAKEIIKNANVSSSGSNGKGPKNERERGQHPQIKEISGAGTKERDNRRKRRATTDQQHTDEVIHGAEKEKEQRKPRKIRRMEENDKRRQSSAAEGDELLNADERDENLLMKLQDDVTRFPIVKSSNSSNEEDEDDDEEGEFQRNDDLDFPMKESHEEDSQNDVKEQEEEEISDSEGEEIEDDDLQQTISIYLQPQAEPSSFIQPFMMLQSSEDAYYSVALDVCFVCGSAGEVSNSCCVNEKEEEKEQVVIVSPSSVAGSSSLSYASSIGSSFLFCVDCGEAFHAFCCNAPKTMKESAKNSWRCPNCKICEICGNASENDVDNLIFCELCDKSFHFNCLSPNLSCSLFPISATDGFGGSSGEKVDDSKWFCYSCVDCSGCSSNSANKREENRYGLNHRKECWGFFEDLCYFCYCEQQIWKEDICMECKKGRTIKQEKFEPNQALQRETFDGLLLSCSNCERKYHTSCRLDRCFTGGISALSGYVPPLCYDCEEMEKKSLFSASSFCHLGKRRSSTDEDHEEYEEDEEEEKEQLYSLLHDVSQIQTLRKESLKRARKKTKTYLQESILHRSYQENVYHFVAIAHWGNIRKILFEENRTTTQSVVNHRAAILPNHSVFSFLPMKARRYANYIRRSRRSLVSLSASSSSSSAATASKTSYQFNFKNPKLSTEGLVHLSSMSAYFTFVSDLEGVQLTHGLKETVLVIMEMGLLMAKQYRLLDIPSSTSYPQVKKPSSASSFPALSSFSSTAICSTSSSTPTPQPAITTATSAAGGECLPLSYPAMSTVLTSPAFSFSTPHPSVQLVNGPAFNDPLWTKMEHIISRMYLSLGIDQLTSNYALRRPSDQFAHLLVDSLTGAPYLLKEEAFRRVITALPLQHVSDIKAIDQFIGDNFNPTEPDKQDIKIFLKVVFCEGLRVTYGAEDSGLSLPEEKVFPSLDPKAALQKHNSIMHRILERFQVTRLFSLFSLSIVFPLGCSKGFDCKKHSSKDTFKQW